MERYSSRGVSGAVRHPLNALRERLPRWKRRRAVPKLHHLLEHAARVGYGARGLVYLSVGLLTLAAAINLAGDPVNVSGAIAWLSQQPLGRVWLVLLGLGLLAFVQWRVLQAVFDADHEGRSRKGLMQRMSQGFSGLAYAGMAISAFSLAARLPDDPEGQAVTQMRDRAETVVGLPFGHWLLAAAGVGLAVVGLLNISRAWREDFTEYLSCSETLCRRVAPLARVGYIARGLAYLPLAVLIFLAGLRSKPEEVATFDTALDAVGRQPGGGWLLAATAVGFIAFGAFSMIEGRFRRIRPPKDLV